MLFHDTKLNARSKYVSHNHNQTIIAQGNKLQEVSDESKEYTTETENPHEIYIVGSPEHKEFLKSHGLPLTYLPTKMHW